jgi:hypothetical protein
VLAARQGSEIEALQALVTAQGLRIAELERRLGMGSDDSGTPSSKESIQAKERYKAERRDRDKDVSSRERSPDRQRGGQPGHEGRGLTRDPAPNTVDPVDPPTQCRGCGAGLAGAADAGTSWSQTWDVRVVRWRVEYLLPRRPALARSTNPAETSTPTVESAAGEGRVRSAMLAALLTEPVLGADESPVEVI